MAGKGTSLAGNRSPWPLARSVLKKTPHVIRKSIPFRNRRQRYPPSTSLPPLFMGARTGELPARMSWRHHFPPAKRPVPVAFAAPATQGPPIVVPMRPGRVLGKRQAHARCPQGPFDFRRIPKRVACEAVLFEHICLLPRGSRRGYQRDQSLISAFRQD